jgi:hypothetical protein
MLRATMSEATTNQQKHAVPAAIKIKFPPGMFNQGIGSMLLKPFF